MLLRTAASLAFAAACSACGGERPGHDITAEARQAFAVGDDYEIKPRTLGRFDCLCVFTSYEDDAEGSMESLGRSETTAQCAVPAVPFDIDEDTGVFLLIDRSRRPARLEVQSFDLRAAPPLSGVPIVYTGCQRAVRARVNERPGHGLLETFLL